jgi:DNA-directed RNA polymerase II subunit RPB2
VMVGKTIEFTKLSSDDNDRSRTDRSMVHHNDEACTVENVVITNNKDNLRSVSIRTSTARRPEVGDKFSSRGGQKGVCGQILNQQDMPYTIDGIVPDIVSISFLFLHINLIIFVCLDYQPPCDPESHDCRTAD